MNERIKELAEQAGARFIPARQLTNGGVMSEYWDNSNLDTQKFAELIIEKSIDLLRDVVTNSPDKYDCADEIPFQEAIAKYFKVSEYAFYV